MISVFVLMPILSVLLSGVYVTLKFYKTPFPPSVGTIWNGAVATVLYSALIFAISSIEMDKSTWHPHFILALGIAPVLGNSMANFVIRIGLAERSNKPAQLY